MKKNTYCFFFFSSRRRHTRLRGDWSSDVCSSDLGLPRSASVVAVRPAQLSFLSRAAFEEFAHKHPEVYRSLLTLIAARLRETDATVAAGSFLPLRGRVACTLLELA